MKDERTTTGAALLCAAMLFALLSSAAWGTGSGEVSTTGGAAGGAALSGSLAKTLEISWIGPGGALVNEGSFVQKKIEEKFNVRLVNRKVDVHNTEQINLMLNTGEMPDAGFLYSSAMDLHLKGLTRAIPKRLVVQFAPSYAKVLDENPPGWKLNRKPGSDDELISLTGLAMNQRAHIMHEIYRYDWLERLGLLPANKKIEALDSSGRIYRTTEPFTIEELERILDAYAKGDPDGDGKANTFGMSACDDINYSWCTIMGSFGFGFGFNVNQGGKVVDWCIAPQYREFLKLVRQWYAKGWLDPEFVTLNRTKMWEKISSGLVGYHNNPFNYADPTSAGLKTRPPMSILEKNKSAKILIGVGEVGKDGKRGVRQWSSGGIFNYNFFVNQKVEDEKLVRILQIFDYVNFDEQGLIMSKYGEEGVHFTWSGKPNASPPTLKQGVTAGQGFGFYNHSITTDSFMPFMYTEVPLALYRWASTEGVKYVIKPYRSDIFNETQYAAVHAKYGNGLETIWKEFMYKGITGEIDVEGSWNAYVEKWRKAGGDLELAELEKAPVVE